MLLGILMLAISLSLLPVPQAQAGDVLTDLGFSTSTQDLEAYDQRADNNPFGAQNTTLSPIAEQYLVEMLSPAEGDPAMQRSLQGDNNLGDIVSGVLPAGSNKYVKAVSVDLTGQGKEHAVAELFYREANHGELYLSIMDPAGSLDNTATNEILVFSNSSATEDLITDYRNQHSYLTLVSGDFDNDGVSEIVVYVPDAAHPHVALYQISDGVLVSTPDQTFTLGGFTKYLYMTSGDITGDNIDDLVVSFNGSVPDVGYSNQGQVYIFKSQNFSLSAPHVFNRLPSGDDNGKNYFTSRIKNASVAIGNLCSGNSDDGHMELVIAGGGVPDGGGVLNVSRTVLGYRYDTASKQWDFDIVLGRQDLGPSELSNVNQVNANTITTLACVDFPGKDPSVSAFASIYINGILLPEYDDVYALWNDMDPGYRYVDYGVAAANFDGNSSRREQMKILREKVRYDSQLSVWHSEGFEVATVGTAHEAVMLPANTTCAAMAAPNTDDDTVIRKYKGYKLHFSDPTVLAVLASPPYFEDLEHLAGGDSYVGCSSTEFTSGEGSSTGHSLSGSITAGAYVSCENEVSIFGFQIAKAEASLEFTAGYTWESEHTNEVTTSVTYGTFGGQDSVALYTIPMDVFSYDVWFPAQPGQPGFWQTMQHHFPYEAAYTVVDLEQYDAIASREGLPVIGGKVFTHTVGCPETYHASSSEMPKIFQPVENTQFMVTGYGDAFTSQSIEINNTTTNTGTFNAAINTRVGAGGANVTAGVILNFEGGMGSSVSSLENSGFTGTVLNMPMEAQDRGYTYQWKLLEYPYFATSEDFIMTVAGLPANRNQVFPVLTYAVQQVSHPPLLPDNFMAVSSNPDSITLQWDNADPNTRGYQLYRYYDFDGGLAGYYEIGDVLPVGTTTYTDTNLLPYTTYKYVIQSIGSRMGEDWSSVLSPEIIGRTATDGDAPTISTQPQAITVAAGSMANFQVIAEPAASASLNERIFYTWQRYANNCWQPVANGNDATLHILNVRESDEGIYRCAVSQQVGNQSITIYSHAARLGVDKNTAGLILQDGEPGTASNVAFGENVPLTATFYNTQTVKPTPRVDFYITCYPEPILEGEDWVYPEVVQNILSANIVNGSTASVEWSPGTYGSYDIVAIYGGDTYYNSCSSNVEGFTCTAAGSNNDAALRITGIDTGILRYGDTAALGATVSNNGQIRSLSAGEITFLFSADSNSPDDGLQVAQTTGANPHWQATALKPGSYTLTASSGTLQVSKRVVVSKQPITVKVVDQVRGLNSAGSPFEVGLLDGTMKFDDTLEGMVTLETNAVADSPAGVYDILITAIAPELTGNYQISTQKGTLTIVGQHYNIKFRGVANGQVTALINGWNVLTENFSSGYTLNAGSTVRFTALPNTGYRVEKWVVNGNSIMINGGAEYDTSAYITTSNLQHNVTVEVFFVPDMCEITYSAGLHGQLQAHVGSTLLGPEALLPAQTSVTFTAIPDGDYMVSQWKVNSSTVTGYTQPTYYHTVTGNTLVEVLFASEEFVPVNYQAAGNGSVTASTFVGAAVANGDIVTKGTTLVFTAIPDDANSIIQEWRVNGQVVQGNSPEYSIENVQEAVEVEVVFVDAISYRVNFNAIGFGGDALLAEVDGESISSGQWVRGYAEVTFTAQPLENYRVKQWKLGSSVILDDDEQPLLDEIYVLDQLQSSVSVTVEFETTITHSVDYSVIDTLPDEDGGENGSLTARLTYSGPSSDYSSGDDIMPGSQVILTAVPDAGYRVKAWVINGVSQVSTDPAYHIDSINDNYVITVEFEAGINPLTYAAVGNGALSAQNVDGQVDSGDEIADGTEVEFTAVPAAGYQVKEWRYNEQLLEGGTENTLTLSIENGGYVEVVFEREYFQLTLGEHLSASIDGLVWEGDEIAGDVSITVTATPPAGYLLSGWYLDGNLLDDEEELAYTFTMLQDTEVAAEFEQQQYNITYTAGINGTLAATADGTAFSSDTSQAGGAEIIFTAQPADGYQADKWYSGDDVVTGSGAGHLTYVIDHLSKTEYIRVTFKEATPVLNYNVAFSAGSGGTISATAGGAPISSGLAIPEGSTMVLTAVPDAGKEVDQWTGAGHGSLSADKRIFTINSLASHEEVSVTFKNISVSPGGGGGAPAIKPPSTPDAAVSVNGSTVDMNLDLEVSGGSAVLTLDPADARTLFSSQQTPIIAMPAVKDVDAYSLELPVSQLSSMQAAGQLTFSSSLGSITIGSNILSGISTAGAQRAGISISSGDKSLLPAEVRAAVGNRPLLQLALSLDGRNIAWNNPRVAVQVSIPYTPTAQELHNPEHIVVWYIDGNGDAVPVTDGRYDTATGSVVFSTTHFSTYAVTYVHTRFTDLSQVEWAQKPIEVMASKGIINGTGPGIYSPASHITRADYLTLLIKTLNLRADFSSNFSDIRPGTYYYESIGIAKKLGIATGSGTNQFNPGAAISRQDMMTLTERALRLCNNSTVQGTPVDLAHFSDLALLADYAVNSAASVVKAGLIQGNNGQLNPLGYTTRAEAAVFLYRIYKQF